MNEIAQTTVDRLRGLEIAQDLAEMEHDVQIRESQAPIVTQRVGRADTIRRLHLEVAAHVTIALGKAMEIGQLLTEQKAAMNHGEWMPWLKGNVPFSSATARNYMQLWERRETLELLNVSNLKTAYSVVRHTLPPQHYEYDARGIFDSAKYPDPFSHCDDEQKRKWIAMWVCHIREGEDPAGAWSRMEWTAVRYTFDEYFNEERTTYRYGMSGPDRKATRWARSSVADLLDCYKDADILDLKFSCLSLWMEQAAAEHGVR